MKIAAIPPMTPPMTAPLFELCVPINAGVVVVDSGPPKAPVGPIAETEGPDGPRIMPGPTSGVSIRRMTCRERVMGL